VNTVSLSFNK